MLSAASGVAAAIMSTVHHPQPAACLQKQEEQTRTCLRYLASSRRLAVPSRSFCLILSLRYLRRWRVRGEGGSRRSTQQQRHQRHRVGNSCVCAALCSCAGGESGQHIEDSGRVKSTGIDNWDLAAPAGGLGEKHRLTLQTQTGWQYPWPYCTGAHP